MNITEKPKPSIKLNEMSAPASLTTNANSIQAGENASHSNIIPKSAQQSNKYAPARRLAARQTLRLAIPNKTTETPTTISSLMHKQSSSQLPPATILRCSTPIQSHNQATKTPLIKTTSPLESHNLYNVLLQGHQKERNVVDSGKFLTLHQPTINLNSSVASDICNKKELFAFTKEISPAGHNKSPIFEEIATQLLPLDDISTAKTTTTTTSLSPNRLFPLSPSSLRSYGNMTDFPDSSSSGVVSPAATFIENFHKKNGTTTTTTTGIVGSNSSSSSTIHSPSMSAGIGGNSSISSVTFNGGGISGTVTTGPTMGRQLNSSSSSSSSSRLKETSSTSQQVSSSSTTTRVEKKSRLHHITSSSSSSQSSSSTSTELKAAALKRDMNEFKNSMSEINDLALGRNSGGNVTPSLTGSNTTLNHHHHHQPPSINDLSNLSSLNSSDAINQLKKKIRSSLENIVDDNIQPNIKFPDDEDEIHLDLVEATNPLAVNGLNSSNVTVDTVKFEEKRCKTESKKKIVTDGFSSEHATSNLAESKRLQAGDIDYQEAKAAAAIRNRMEVDGIKAEQNAAVIHEALSLRAGDVTQQASNNVAAASIKVQSDTFSADKKAISQSQQSQTMTSNGIISQEKHVSSASQSNYTMTHKGVSSSGSSMISSHMSSANGQLFRLSDFKMDDLMSLSGASGQKDIDQAIVKYSNMLTSCVNSLRERRASTEETSYLDKINEVIRRAWEVPTHGHELGYSLCDSLRKSGGLDLLMHNCVKGDMQIKFSSAKLLEQCLTTENRSHVVDNGLDKVVNVACVCTKNSSTEYSRVGTGILEHLFKHSEGTCSDVIKLGGLDAVLFECRTSDVETLRHCASALANLSLYGGAENQEAMILRKVPMWLFPLAFHTDDNIKYYACLAIAVLVANKEIEAEVLKSGCLDLVEPFVTSHDPSEFAKSNLAHAHGQSKHWLERLVPVLSSNREEARSLAAFHFCMEAGIKREQGNTEIFREIGAIEALKTVASCPNAIASKFAAQALRLIGETVPHKLSQQVPLWSVEDVQEWVKQIGFGQFVKQFQESQVDGDLLLKLNEDNLRNDIGIANGILVKRFERELQNLKRMADYSSKDIAKLHQFLAEMGPEYCTYTYSMVNAGIDKTSLPHINEDMLIAECGIKNSIHRLRILNSVKTLENALVSSTDDNVIKTLDVFVSYRRSNGSQLASLLKVHLQLRGFSVFIDVERLEAGKFDNGLLNSIRQAKNFVLVLTPHALERCIDDKDCKDWVHREIVAALNANCNIIPIIDQFDWPEAECLPEDMRSICHFNGVTWIHDYQDACIDKLERFMRGEKNIDRIIGMTPGTPGTAVTYQRMHSNDSEYSVGGSNAGSTTGSIGNGSAVNSGASATSHHGNRYRTSSTPGISQQRFGNLLSSTGKVGSIGSQLSMYGRGSKRNILTPFRTQHITGQQRVVPMGGSMQNVSPLTYRPPRRSSAVSITTQKAQKANSNYRSHSVDGLLDNKDPDTGDQRIAEAAALVAAGSMALTNASSTSTLQPAEDFNCSIASLTNLQGEKAIETVTRRQKSTNLPPINPQHRKSRSLDHFLDEQTLATIVAPPSPTDGTQSMHNLAVAITPELLSTTTTNALPSPCLILTRDTKSLTPERVATLRSNVLNRQSPEGISSAEDEQEDNQNNLIKSKNSPTSTTTPITMKSQTRAAAHLHRGNSTASTNSRVAKDTANHSLGDATAAVNNQQVNPNNKTIFNRTMKKVRSLMKK